MRITTRRQRAVILVLVHKPNVSRDEAFSLRQCVSILGDFDIVVVCPSRMDISAYQSISAQIGFCHINPRWQSSYGNFNRLKISPLLYWKFRQYDYILFYELDAFVFRDELEHWCAVGYDYIGAPWFRGFANYSRDSPFVGVGNGGFSLRRTRAALRVLRSFSYIRKPRELLGLPSGMLRTCRDLTFWNNTFYLFNDFSENEDIFWGIIVSRNFPWFKVAPVHEASKFSFECNPRRLFELNKNQLPFGCHGWQKYEPEFWVPHINQRRSLVE